MVSYIKSTTHTELLNIGENMYNIVNLLVAMRLQCVFYWATQHMIQYDIYMQVWLQYHGNNKNHTQEIFTHTKNHTHTHTHTSSTLYTIISFEEPNLKKMSV